jgi:hypothetical protein
MTRAVSYIPSCPVALQLRSGAKVERHRLEYQLRSKLDSTYRRSDGQQLLLGTVPAQKGGELLTLLQNWSARLKK